MKTPPPVWTQEVNAETFRAALARKPRPIYEQDGILFDSAIEIIRWRELRLMEHAGLIRELTAHPSYTLAPRFVDNWGKIWKRITYTPDYRYWDCALGHWIVEEVKVFRRQPRSGRLVKPTEKGETRLRYNLFARNYPDLRLVVTYREQAR